MDDLLTRHADNVAKANAEHMKDLTALRAMADVEIREKIAAFRARIIELVKVADEARDVLSAEIGAIIQTLSEKASPGCYTHETSSRNTF